MGSCSHGDGNVDAGLVRREEEAQDGGPQDPNLEWWRGAGHGEPAPVGKL